MKSFIYTYCEFKVRGDIHTTQQVRLYAVVKNVPTLVIQHQEQFVSEWQLVMMALQHAEALPNEAFSLSPTGGFAIYSADHMKVCGYANINRVS